MPNQVANYLAVGTGSPVEFPGDVDPFRLVAVKPIDFAHVLIPRDIHNIIGEKISGEAGYDRSLRSGGAGSTRDRMSIELRPIVTKFPV